jgi:hypothetical protein
MSGAIIFIHGLGDSGAGWSHLRDQLPIPDVTWMFPDAPQVREQRTENREQRTKKRDQGTETWPIRRCAIVAY